jgi:hypothetical protein
MQLNCSQWACLIHSFKSYINEELKGFYRSSYFDVASNWTRHLAVTQFESHFARKAFPCLDEPDFKAEFTVSITAKNGSYVVHRIYLFSGSLSYKHYFFKYFLVCFIWLPYCLNPSSIWCRGSNPRPLDHEPLAFTTRPRLLTYSYKHYIF